MKIKYSDKYLESITSEEGQAIMMGASNHVKVKWTKIIENAKVFTSFNDEWDTRMEFLNKSNKYKIIQ